MEVSKISIREGLREAVRILIGKVDGKANFVFTTGGSNETESLCDVMSKIGDALKDYDRAILEEMEEEEDMVAEIVEADEFTLEINRVIGKVKRGFKPSELSESSSPQTARRPIMEVGRTADIPDAVQSVKTNETETFAHPSVHVDMCLVNETQVDSIIRNAKDLSKKPCIFCSGIHAPWTCSNVTNTSERKQIIKEKRLCFNCLGSHKIAHCKSDKNCKNCGKYHNTSICFAGGRTSGDRKERVTRGISNPVSENLHVEEQNERKAEAICIHVLKSDWENITLKGAETLKTPFSMYDFCRQTCEHSGTPICAAACRRWGRRRNEISDVKHENYSHLPPGRMLGILYMK